MENKEARQPANPPVRVSVSEAARLFGVSGATIRLAIKGQELKYIVFKGRYKINFESLLIWSQKNKRRQNILGKQGIGQYVDRWKIKNKLYSPDPQLADALQGQKSKK